MKKGLCLFLLFVVTISLSLSVSIMVLATSEGTDCLTFTINPNSKSCSVSGYIDTQLGDIVIPTTHNGYPVTGIDSSAFKNCTSLTSIVIPNTVQYIGLHAFENCVSLTSVTIAESVTTINWYAFKNCSNLNKVNITDIASWCNMNFSGYESNPLYYAKNLYLNGNLVTDLVIPEGVTKIKDSVFRNCESITSVIMPSSLSTIEDHAFAYCSSLKNLTIPNGLTTIDECAFWMCTSLKSLSLPDSVTIVGGEAFYHCSALTSVIIGEGLTSISYAMFSDCKSLKNIRIGNNVMSIGDKAFQFCTSLTSVTIPNSVNKIGNGSFNLCSALTDITIPNSVNSISDETFKNCFALKSITIPNSVNSIGISSFENCYSLENVVIPQSITSIGDFAFAECDNLRYIFYDGTSIDWQNIDIGLDNSFLVNSTFHYNTTEHTHTLVKKAPLLDDTTGSLDDICSICGHINSSNKLVYINNYITAVDTNNVALNSTNNDLLLDISACKNLNEAIIEMDGYTLTTTPNSEYGYYGTGSKVQVTDATGSQVAEYTLVVRGDVNGDSVCDGIDLMLIELAKNKHTELDGIHLAAGDLVIDDKIDERDFQAIVNHALSRV